MMGDRANIYLEQRTDWNTDRRAGMYLYTHWSGDDWPEALREALKFGRKRWDDEQYLARIIVNRVFSDLVDSEGGGGLSLTLGDNGHPIIVVEMAEQTVSFAEEGLEANREKRYARVSFADYVAQPWAHYPEGGR